MYIYSIYIYIIYKNIYIIYIYIYTHTSNNLQFSSLIDPQAQIESKANIVLISFYQYYIRIADANN